MPVFLNVDHNLDDKLGNYCTRLLQSDTTVILQWITSHGIFDTIDLPLNFDAINVLFSMEITINHSINRRWLPSQRNLFRILSMQWLKKVLSKKLDKRRWNFHGNSSQVSIRGGGINGENGGMGNFSHGQTQFPHFPHWFLPCRASWTVPEKVQQIFCRTELNLLKTAEPWIQVNRVGNLVI